MYSFIILSSNFYYFSNLSKSIARIFLFLILVFFLSINYLYTSMSNYCINGKLYLSFFNYQNFWILL